MILKKTTLLALCSAFLASTSMLGAKAQQGFYAGMQAGGGRLSGKNSLTLYSQTAVADLSLIDNQNAKANGFLINALGGYRWVAGKWCLGGEIFLGWSNYSAKLTGTMPNAATVTPSLKQERDWSSGLVGVFGYDFDTVIPYVKLGLTGARFKHTYSEVDSASGATYSSSNSKYVPGALMGLGVEKKFGNITMRLDYAFTQYKSFTMNTSYDDAPDYPQTTSTSKPQVHSLTLDVVYAF